MHIPIEFVVLALLTGCIGKPAPIPDADATSGDSPDSGVNSKTTIISHNSQNTANSQTTIISHNSQNTAANSETTIIAHNSTANSQTTIIEHNSVETSEEESHGSIAEPGSHPHMVAITVGRYFNSLICGGSLVSRRVVLTAAHCIEPVFINGSLYSSLGVTVGTNTWNDGGQKYDVAHNITHPNFIKRTFKNDIGLFILTKNVVLSDVVKVIELAFDYIDDVPATVAGWGRTGKDDPASEDLLQIKVPTITGQECVERFLPVLAAYVPNNLSPVNPVIEICTFYGKGTGFCDGDSGSALTRQSDGRQIGIVSWGLLCARGRPDVYARISAYEDWLTQHINNHTVLDESGINNNVNEDESKNEVQ